MARIMSMEKHGGIYWEEKWAGNHGGGYGAVENKGGMGGKRGRRY